MIAELFYSRELREVIADLHCKGDLNIRALSLMHNSIWVIMFSYFIISLFVYFISQDDIWSFLLLEIILSTCFVLITYLDTKRSVKRLMVYIKGKNRMGIVRKVNVHKMGMMAAPMRGIVVTDCENNDCYSMGPYLAWSTDETLPEIGDRIKYYSLGKKLYQNMPDREEIKKDYCLSKSILNGDAYA